jgi:tetratricopeptide (TPR) repeat protein
MRRARDREIQRLLNLLKNDPDAGLRFAIPMGGAGARGVAAPGDRLTSHNVDFNLNALGGGRPADAWQIEAEMRRRLLEEYRRAATRELGLGRHRRAAYIFAELLGDLSAAANALEQGRHYREAAALYRDRLKNVRAAARCLEAGGLLPEAIEIYLELKEYEKAGDLNLRIERQEEATRCYEQAVSAAVVAGRPIEAARLLEEKLHRTDAALAALLQGWPAHAEAARCLAEHFKLLQRHGRHEEALHVVGQVAPEAGSADLPYVMRLAEPLADVATGYPDDAVRHRAGDVIRVMAGRWLAGASDGDAATLIRAVTRLEPADRLLPRDGQRFFSQRQAAAAKKRPATPPRPTTPSNRAVFLRSFHLGGQTDWIAATSYGDSLFVLGTREQYTRDENIVIARARWSSGQVNVAVASTRGRIVGRPWLQYVHREATGTASLPSVLLAPLSIGLSSLRLSGLDEALVLSGVGGVHAERVAAAAAADDAGVLWAVVADADEPADHALNSYNLAGPEQLLSSTDVEIARDAAGRPYPVHLAVRRNRVFLATGQTVLCFESGSGGQSSARTFHLPSLAWGMAVSFQWTASRAAVTFEDGGAVVWPDWGRVVPFAQGLVDPVAAFTRTGELVALSQRGGEGRVYHGSSAQPGAFTRTGSFDCAAHAPPLAVLAAGTGSEFGVVFTDGLVQVFSPPGG